MTNYILNSINFSLYQLAIFLGGQLEGPGDRIVSGIKGIKDAGPKDITFLANPKYVKILSICQAGVVLVSFRQKVPKKIAVIRVNNPYLAYAKLLTYAVRKSYVPLGVHKRAVIESNVVLGRDVSIHALAYIGSEAVIGDRVILYCGVYIGDRVKIDNDSILYPNVVVYHDCLIGKRCIIHAGTVIGSDGFGFVSDGDQHIKIPQIGIVQIDDDVELGANNTIDRAAMERTWIKSGVKTDNMVHIAHGCVIGEHSLLVAQVGVSGSTKIGRQVVIGGQVGLAGHIVIGDKATIGSQSGVARSINPGEIMSGTPAMPHKLWLRTSQLIRRLPELFNRIRALENTKAQSRNPDA